MLVKTLWTNSELPKRKSPCNRCPSADWNPAQPVLLYCEFYFHKRHILSWKPSLLLIAFLPSDNAVSVHISFKPKDFISSSIVLRHRIPSSEYKASSTETGSFDKELVAQKLYSGPSFAAKRSDRRIVIFYFTRSSALCSSIASSKANLSIESISPLNWHFPQEFQL